MVDAADQVADTTAPETNFEDAFAALANLEQAAQGDAGEEPAKKPDEAPAAVEGEPAPAETPPAAAEAAPAETPPAPEAPKEPPPSDDVLARLAQLVKDTPQQPAAPAPQPAPQPQPLYADDEVAYLQNYDKEWPDVSRAESLKRRGEHQQLINYVFNEVATELRPLMETVATLSQRTFLTDLSSKVEDYDTVRDAVIDWVGTQPEYLQHAYNRVIESGSVEEIADLIGRYKRDTGAVAAQSAPAPATKKVDTELPPATKQAAAALAPVSSKRTVVPQAVDPTDFEAAFASFASKV